jgi:hypothetical protein
MSEATHESRWTFWRSTCGLAAWFEQLRLTSNKVAGARRRRSRERLEIVRKMIIR